MLDNPKHDRVIVHGHARFNLRFRLFLASVQVPLRKTGHLLVGMKTK